MKKIIILLLALLALPVSFRAQDWAPTSTEEPYYYRPSPKPCDTVGWEMLYKREWIPCNEPGDTTLVALYCLKYVLVDSTPIVERRGANPPLIHNYFRSWNNYNVLDSAEYAHFKELEKWLLDGAKVEAYYIDSMCVDCPLLYRAVRKP